MSEGVKQAAGSPQDGASISFDQLDRLVRVTTIHGWVYLGTLFAVCAAAAAFARVLSGADEGLRRGHTARSTATRWRRSEPAARAGWSS